MANIPPIQFKRSHTPGVIPTPGDLAVGEVVLNIPDASLYTKDSANNIVKMGIGTDLTDSDFLYRVSQGAVSSVEDRELEYTLVVQGDDTSWQNSTAAQNLPVGTKVTVFYDSGASELWDVDIGSELSTDSDWDLEGGRYFCSYATYDSIWESLVFVSSIYSSTYRCVFAVQNSGDHASLGARNNYSMYHYFRVPVDIGNGTILGKFWNGRVSEYFADYCIEFYDANGDLITSQTWTGATGRVTNEINVSGNITGVKSIIMRGDNAPASSGNPGFNRINLYVGGSTDFPAASTPGNTIGGARVNAGNTYNQNPDDEVHVIAEVITTAAIPAGDAGNMFTFSTDYAVDNADQTPTFNFYLHKPKAIAGGTFANGRVNYQSQYFPSIDIRYFDGNGAGLFSRTYNYEGYGDREFPSFRNVQHVEMQVVESFGADPALARWFPNLCEPTAAEPGRAMTKAEVWIKNSDAGETVYLNGETETLPAWVKVSS